MTREEQQLEWAACAPGIVAEAARQEGVALPELLADAIAQAIRVHWLTKPGAFELVTAYANSERQAGRLALKQEATSFES